MGKNWQEKSISLLGFKNKNKENSNLLMFMKKPEKFIYIIKTKTGKKIKVSGDHPVLTENGMIPAEKLTTEKKIITYPFSGVKYEKPLDKTVITIEDISKFLDKIGITNKGNAKIQVLNRLKETDLLPLKYNSPQLPFLIKLMGFIFGDGVITFLKNNKGFVHFYGKSEDLELIREDFKKINLVVQKVYTRDRKHKINTFYGEVKFDFKSECLIKKSTGFAALLACLGTPYGRKTHKKYRVPQWLMKAPLWQKRLFLASFFGAELSSPRIKKRYPQCHQLNMNKQESLSDNGIDFLNDIRLLVSEFGVVSNYPVFVKGNNYEGVNGKTVGLRLVLKGNPSNLINLYNKIGYEYNINKQKTSSLAINYLKEKKRFLQENSLHILKGKYSSLLEKIKFSYFEDYIKDKAYGNRGFTVEEIENIEKIEYNGDVYDFTVNHKDHNFIANNVVVSNCGMRLVTTNLTFKDVKPKLIKLVDTLFRTVPAGVGSRGFVKVDKKQFIEIMESGVKWCVDNNYGWKDDLKKCEGHGVIDWADHSQVSEKAISRGLNQLGTLGSGNHYLEIQLVKASNIFDEKTAKVFGIHTPDQIVVMTHCGSRGFGHQIASDYLKVFDQSMKKYNIQVNDRELSCAPFSSEEGQKYYKAMACAANMAFANRQVILHRIREGFEKIFNKKAEEMEMNLIYDVAHNIAKVEKHKIDGKIKELVVHRKGSTRAFPPNHDELPSSYKKIGQPVIIGGSMETGSYLLVGTEKAMQETFGTTAHGSGRTMSRTQAKKQVRGEQLQKDMQKRGIYVKAVSMPGLAEEAGLAYKDINEVVDSLNKAGISKPVCSFKPIGNIKG